jgi:hypothetical protein
VCTWSTGGGRGEEAGRGGVEPCTIISLTSCCCWWLKVVKDGADITGRLFSASAARIGRGEVAVAEPTSRSEEQLSGDWSRPLLRSRCCTEGEEGRNSWWWPPPWGWKDEAGEEKTLSSGCSAGGGGKSRSRRAEGLPPLPALSGAEPCV